MKVVIEEYNPLWKDLFRKAQQELESTFNHPAIQIEHMGSTAVENLGAKPVIDILIGVPDFSQVSQYIPLIQQLGYQYVDDYEDIMPYRRFFTKDAKEMRTHHIHMVELNSDFWERHLFFRDYLREHSETKDAYYQLKKELALKYENDRSAYGNAKTKFIQEIERKNK